MKKGQQLELLPPSRPTAAQRKALIRERLHGYPYRQAAREARRRRANLRRKRQLAGERAPKPHPPRQLPILGKPEGYLF